MTYILSRPFRRVALVAVALGAFATAGALAQTGNGSSSSAADASSASSILSPSHPDRYVVKKGDTLWDIAGVFLRNPWYWPEIWQVNPQIENPHLIYPGDVLSLAYIDGRPVIRLERGRTASTGERLSPRIRTQSLKEAIPTIPYAVLDSFLSRPSVFDKDEVKSLPYIVALREGLIGSAGTDVYVRGTANAPVGTDYAVVHVGDPIVDPDDDEVVGYQAIYVGQGQLRRAGDPGTVRLVKTTREALVGDPLVEPKTPNAADFLPHAPKGKVDGQIISVVDGTSLVGQYQVVVINRGSRDGIERGDVLRAFEAGALIKDPVRRDDSLSKKVKLPDESAGIMMVFRVFDRISYALVMEATLPLRMHDAVRNP